MPDGETVRVYCNACLQMTKHVVVAKRVLEDEAEGRVISVDTFEMVECCGCEQVSLRHTSEYPSLGAEPEVSMYPPRVARRTPRWLHKLPDTVRGLMGEVYTAFHADSRRLAVMGARALIDVLAREQVGDQGDMRKQLKALHAAGFISDNNRDDLAAAFDAGSAAAHRGHEPTKREVELALNIVENVIESVYTLGGAATTLRKKTPPRHPAPATKP